MLFFHHSRDMSLSIECERFAIFFFEIYKKITRENSKKVRKQKDGYCASYEGR